MLAILIFCILLVIVITKSAVVIEPGFAGICERLGLFIKVINPGLHFIIPFIEKVQIVSLAETIIESSSISISDNNGLKLNCTLKITKAICDPKLAKYAVSDLEQSILTAAIHQLQKITKEKTSKDILTNSNQIEETLKERLNKTCLSWGVETKNIYLNIL